MSEEICVAHLVWAPLGTPPLRRFLDSYRRHPSGVQHRLVILYNGFQRDYDTAPWEAELSGIAHEVLHIPTAVQDIDAYRYAADHMPATRYCFLNSYCVLLVDDWLTPFMAALDSPAVGLAGASGSWASRSSHMRFGLHLGGPYAPLLGDPAHNSRLFRALAAGDADTHATGTRARLTRRLRTAMTIPRTLRGFPRFPAHHLRSNAFAVSRDVWTRIRFPQLRNKLDAHLLESGRASITRQVQALNLRAVVVGRDGTYEPERWPSSRSFWQADQQNLMIADNQSEAYANGDAQLRLALSRYAWGAAAEPVDRP
jgi:hypothetical protein